LQKITDKGFTKIGSLVNLNTLELYECQISDAGVGCFAELIKLRKLMLHGCMRIQNLAFLSKLSTLKTLSLANCYGLNDKECIRINLQSLENLSLSGCRITDGTLEHLSHSTRLKYLNAANCANITDAGIDHIANISTITALHLSGQCKLITDQGLKYVANLKNLVHFSMPWAENITDEGVNSLAQLQELQRLDIFMCPKVTPNVRKTLPKNTKVFLQ